MLKWPAWAVKMVCKKFLMCYLIGLCSASNNEMYAVPHTITNKWDSYIFKEKEYIIENINVNWENARILCRGNHNASLVVLDSKEKAFFLAEALAESEFDQESVWVGARRANAEDPSGYRWSNGVELQRTALDVVPDEGWTFNADKYPAWLNRTHVPVPESGADCVAMERVRHDRPIFLDLPCQLERGFACERDAVPSSKVTELHSVRCRTGLYRVFDAHMDWHQAAAYCILRKMALANIATMRCLKKLGTTMLKSRPSIESAWVGASGSLGKWSWIDSGASIFIPSSIVADGETWPPIRRGDKGLMRASGCLQIDRHVSHPPVFLEARCERKMQFICYQGFSITSTTALPSDDFYHYMLVKQQLSWQQAYDNCRKENGNLASVDNNEILIQLLLVMGENKENTINHIWLSGHLNMTKDPATDAVSYMWYNPTNGKRIPDNKQFGDSPTGVYIPPWLDEPFTTDNPCLNLDRQEHLSGLVYGLPCDTEQYSICMIDKAVQFPNLTVQVSTEALSESPIANLP